MGCPFKAPERTLIVDVFDAHPRQSKKRKGTAGTLRVLTRAVLEILTRTDNNEDRMFTLAAEKSSEGKKL